MVEGLVGPGTSTAKFGLEKDLAAASAEDKQPGVAGLGTNTMKSELADDLAVAAAGSNKPVKVPLYHMEKGWVEKPPRSSPSHPVVLSLHSPSYSNLTQ